MKFHKEARKKGSYCVKTTSLGVLLSTAKREDLDSYQCCRVSWKGAVTQEEQALPSGNTMFPDILLFACNDLRTHS